jgi:two-component system, sensor histidine kinase and response regulator
MTPVFDYDASLTRMGQDEALLREMAVLLLEDGPVRMREAVHGLKSRDALRILYAAHTLKGLAANFGAARAVAAASRLEDLARREIWGEMSAATDALQQALEELLSALRPLVAETSQSV